MSPANPRFSIGGQAVLEGVMMRSPAAVATAVRKPDGAIALVHRPFRGVTARLRFLDVPILRGAVNLVETLYLGMQSLNWSAEQAMEGETKQPQVGAGPAIGPPGGARPRRFRSIRRSASATQRRRGSSSARSPCSWRSSCSAPCSGRAGC